MQIMMAFSTPYYQRDEKKEFGKIEAALDIEQVAPDVRTCP